MGGDANPPTFRGENAFRLFANAVTSPAVQPPFPELAAPVKPAFIFFGDRYLNFRVTYGMGPRGALARPQSIRCCLPYPNSTFSLVVPCWLLLCRLSRFACLCLVAPPHVADSVSTELHFAFLAGPTSGGILAAASIAYTVLVLNFIVSTDG